MQRFETIAARVARRTSASSGVLALLLIVVPGTFAACGDDGNLLGSDDSAGTSAGTSAGSAGNRNDAGSGDSDPQNSAGVDSGGKAGSGGTASSAGMGGSASLGGSAGHASGGTGGGSDCNLVECKRANVCLDHCGGNVVYTGCCSCDANTVEQLTCDSVGGQGSGGQGSTDCAGTTCTTGQTCVAYRTIGGAVFPPDADNMCAAGKHVEGNYCQPDFAYTCAALTGCSEPATTCHCAANTACANDTVCQLPTDSAWLDASADLVCQQLAP